MAKSDSISVYLHNKIKEQWLLLDKEVGVAELSNFIVKSTLAASWIRYSNELRMLVNDCGSDINSLEAIIIGIQHLRRVLPLIRKQVERCSNNQTQEVSHVR
jgi:hypothetical protein